MIKIGRNYPIEYENLMERGSGYIGGEWINLNSNYKREKNLIKPHPKRFFKPSHYNDVNDEVEKKLRYLDNVLNNVRGEMEGMKSLNKTYNSNKTEPNIRKNWVEVENEFNKRNLQLDYYERGLINQINDCLKDSK